MQETVNWEATLVAKSTDPVTIGVENALHSAAYSRMVLLRVVCLGFNRCLAVRHLQEGGNSVWLIAFHRRARDFVPLRCRKRCSIYFAFLKSGLPITSQFSPFLVREKVMS
jgi:hypothetical protein